MDALMAKLSEQSEKYKQKQGYASSDKPEKKDNGRALHRSDSSSPDNIVMTPESSSNDEPSSKGGKEDNKVHVDMAEMMRLKKELDDAKDQIARQKQELDHSRIMKHTVHQAIGSSAETEAIPNGLPFGHTNGRRQTTLSPPGPFGNPRPDNQWDARSTLSDTPSMENFNGAPNIWQTSMRPMGNGNLQTVLTQPYQSATPLFGQGNRTWDTKGMGSNGPQMMMPQQQQMFPQRTFSGPASSMGSNDFNQFQTGAQLRRSNTQNRAASFYPQVRGSGWDAYDGSIASLDGMTMAMNNVGSGPFQGSGMYPSPVQYQPRPIGTPLSPTAAEFRAGSSSVNPWNATVSVQGSPCGYRADLLRRLLPQSRLMSRTWSLSIIVVFSIVALLVTGNTSSTRSFAATISKLPSSYSRSSRLVPSSKSSRSSRPLSPRRILSW